MAKKQINLYSSRRRGPVSPRRRDSRPILHRARLVVPISQPAIEDGAVVVAEGTILDVGPFPLLRRQWPEAPARDHDDTALLPALVNGHAHLDLSALAGQVQPKGSMAEWIRSLLATREQYDEDHLEKARLLALDSLRTFGTGIVGDIDSSGISLRGNASDVVITQTFVEVFGLHTQSLEVAIDHLPPAARKILADNQGRVSLAAHAPYTTSATLLRKVKEWGTARAKIISVHAAESEEEILFLRSGQGPLRDLLEERGHEPDRWEVPGCSTITYLDRLGFLDSRTICVHAVQLGEEEVQILRRSGAGVCLCPRSNLFIGHGLPPVKELLEAQICCSIGTDSLASNADLNLFEEMAVLMEECSISPDAVLAMATLNGARNLGMASRYGSLEKGKRWVAIRVAAVDSEGIVAAGCQGAVEWVS
jgi:cytosine/adenosine deaminase-related metal-dependent hydrolase